MAIDPVTAALDLGGKLIDRFLPDKAANDAAKAELVRMQLAGELASIQGQLDTNKTEAASASVFVAGWRPFVGWIAGAALAEDMIIRPLLQQVSTLFGHPIVLQPLDVSTLLTLLGGLLGFGAMRSFDKTVGGSSGH